MGHEPSYTKLLVNTGGLIILGFASAGVLYVLPENLSGWSPNELKNNNIFESYWQNIKNGPRLDKDDWFLNYVAHPYCGAVYYMTARSSGFNALGSLTYSILMSNFWEYGIEAFAEIPSIQDLIITPLIGSLFGEVFYLTKREIVRNQYRVLNSRFLGHTCTFLLDPLSEVVDILGYAFGGGDKFSVSASSRPIPIGKEFGYGISLGIRF
ncbi:MAG: DUF3943 domain-containing protein [Bacteroidales bacterium]